MTSDPIRVELSHLEMIGMSIHEVVEKLIKAGIPAILVGNDIKVNTGIFIICSHTYTASTIFEYRRSRGLESRIEP